MMFILPDADVSVYDLLDDEQVLEFINKGIYNGQRKAFVSTSKR